MTSKSFWMSISVAPQATTLQGDERCDVAVIGSGIVGLSTAYELSQRGRSVRFSLASSKAIGGSPRSASATTTPRVNCGGPNLFPTGWQRLSRRSRHVAALKPESCRFFVPNTTSGSEPAGITTSHISRRYSAYRWDPRASSDSVNAPARRGIASRSTPNPARYT